MTIWIVLGVIALVLLLICLLPVGVDLSWREEDFSLRLRIGRFSLGLGDKGKRRTKEKEPKEKKEKKEKSSRKKPDWAFLKLLIRRGYRALCRIVSRLRVDILRIHFLSAFPDPAATAMAYAAAGTAMEGLLHLGGKRLIHPDLRAETDFQGDTPRLDLRLVTTWRIGALLGAAFGFGFGFLKDYIAYKREVARYGKSSDR